MMLPSPVSKYQSLRPESPLAMVYYKPCLMLLDAQPLLQTTVIDLPSPSTLGNVAT